MLTAPHTTVVAWVASDDEGIKSGIVNTFDETVVDDPFDGSVVFRMFDGPDRIAAAQEWIDQRNKPYDPDEPFEDDVAPIEVPAYSISDVLGLPKPPVMARTVEPEDIVGDETDDKCDYCGLTLGACPYNGLRHSADDTSIAQRLLDAFGVTAADIQGLNDEERVQLHERMTAERMRIVAGMSPTEPNRKVN